LEGQRSDLEALAIFAQLVSVLGKAGVIAAAGEAEPARQIRFNGVTQVGANKSEPSAPGGAQPLLRTAGQHVDVRGVNIDGNCTNALDGIYGKEDISRTAERAEAPISARYPVEN
jgi:hypothetical protein